MDFKALMDSDTLTDAEKKYVFDIQFRHGGHFYKSLMDTIARADLGNRAKLALAFPDDVAAYVAWTEGDLAQRVRAIPGMEGA